MSKLNTLSLQNGRVKVNGTEICQVTDFEIKSIPGNDIMNVTLRFDVPIKSFEASNLTQELHTVTGEEITIPVSIGSEQIGAIKVKRE